MSNQSGCAGREVKDRVTLTVCSLRLDLLVVRLKNKAESQDCGGKQEVKHKACSKKKKNERGGETDWWCQEQRSETETGLKCLRFKCLNLVVSRGEERRVKVLWVVSWSKEVGARKKSKSWRQVEKVTCSWV